MSLSVGKSLRSPAFDVLKTLLRNALASVRLFALLSTALLFDLPPLVQLATVLYLIFLFLKFYQNTYASYQAFINLGRGGTPSNWWGWWRVTRLKYCAALSDVLEPPCIPLTLDPYHGLLRKLPIRQGTRPIVDGVAPQRQINQTAPLATYHILDEILASIAAQNPNRLYVDTSFLEKHTTALFAHPTKESNARQTTSEFGYEICHPHKKDGSLHMIIHPEDVRMVIEKGWGERHPFSQSQLVVDLYFHNIKGDRPPVPETLVFVYAPRNEAELDVVKELLRAAVWWIAGVELGKDELFLRNCTLKLDGDADADKMACKTTKTD